MILKIKTKPNSEKQEIINEDEYKINLKSRSEGGKANC